MSSVISYERNWLGASGEVSSNEAATARCRLADVCWLALVILNKLIRQSHTPIKWQNLIIDAMNTQVSDGVVAALTSTNQATAQHTYGLELLGPRTSKRVTHPTAPTEARREARARIHTEVTLDLLDDSVDKGNIFAIGVGPASILAIGRYQDGTSLCSAFETVPGLNAVTVGNRVHVSASPMEGEDKVMWLVWVVVVGDFQDVLAAIDVVDSVAESRLFAAARGCSGIG
jgi:hypothetical protein